MRHRLILPLSLIVLTAALTLPVPAWAQRICTPAFDFEDGTLQGFTVQPVSGPPLWHNANNVCGANLLVGHSPTDTLYYGQDGTCDFETGNRNAANVISPALATGALNRPFTLEFNYLLSAEGGFFDQTLGEVSFDGGATWLHAFSKSDLINDNQWHAKVVDVAANLVLPVGAKPTHARFLFDTIDDLFNNFTGWHLDDVQLCGLVEAPAIPTLSSLGMAVLILLLAGTSMFLLRRRRQART